MVVGKPGSGKTTYLQRVVTECNAGGLQAHRIPVLIRLREFMDDGRDIAYSVERYLEQDWRLSEVEARLVLDGGRSLVLLDGLDEVTGVDGKAIAKQIKRFAQDYPQVQVIVTCRTQSQESRFERFDYVEVADFDKP
jgi:predicted NACHT family NTPase